MTVEPELICWQETTGGGGITKKLSRSGCGTPKFTHKLKQLQVKPHGVAIFEQSETRDSWRTWQRNTATESQTSAGRRTMNGRMKMKVLREEAKSCRTRMKKAVRPGTRQDNVNISRSYFLSGSIAFYVDTCLKNDQVSTKGVFWLFHSVIN